MKRKILCFLFLVIAILFLPKKTFAFSRDDYSSRIPCDKYELSQFHDDGSITIRSCHPTYELAKQTMIEDGGRDLAILVRFDNNTFIVDANNALVDLTHNSGTINLYSEKELINAHTYLVGASGYGAVDAALIDSDISYRNNSHVVKVKIGGYEGWLMSGYVEIVPTVWVKSSSTYTVSNDYIKHNYVSKIQNYYSGSAGNTIGPKPENINTGTYYSYDGHYFYDDRFKMITDYRNHVYTNAVNSNSPYYNYYQFLPNHSRTTYSSTNLDEYIRNVLGYKRDVYGTTALSNQGILTSRLYGKGTFFYNAQELYGVNALLAFGLSKNETGNGRSNLAINKNNGFGLNAVDSNPLQAANWYATFSSSILGYANKWVTYGYSRPFDWRYFGGHYGNKYVGMNVKYASDVYWGEKMANNYYNVDSVLGFQDYNFYQLGITTQSVPALAYPTYNSKTVYNYKSSDSPVIIVEEVEGQEINGNKKWYKVVSDLNIDAAYNEITAGYYNWNGYVYVPAAYITKINTAKNSEDGYKSPNDVIEYQDKNYKYDLYIENAVLKPKVAITVKDSDYYYSPTLTSTSKIGTKVLSNKYVMVYATAYDENYKEVAYLITSDYKYDQKEWVSADSITFTSAWYGQVNVPGTNTYAIITPTTVDSFEQHISGLYTYAYVPILEERRVDGIPWYKVPVNLSGNTNEYGWILASASDFSIAVAHYETNNTPPVITASNKEVIQGLEFNPLEGVSAADTQDGNLTSKIEVISNEVNINTVGEYLVTYKVTDSKNLSVTKTITVKVIKNESPVITANDIKIKLGDRKPDLLKDVTSTDKEDGNIKEIVVDESKVNYQKVGKYELTYKAKDSFGNETLKTVTLEIVDNEAPTITANDVSIMINDSFDPLKGVSAKDDVDGDLTKDIKVIKNTVDTKKAGTYEVTYEVTDKNSHTVTKTIKVTVSNKTEKIGRFDLDYLKQTNKSLSIKGYSTIDGIDNNLKVNIDYKVVFENTTTKEIIYEKALVRITDDSKITYPTPSSDGKDYKYSWFEGTIDFSQIPNGDYVMYVIASSDKYFSKNIVNNQMFSEQVTSIENTGKYLMTRNNYFEATKPVEIIIRSEKIGDKDVSSLSNQFGQLEEIKFTDSNKLYIYGNAFSTSMDLGTKATVSRKIIFENVETYERKSFDLGYIDSGMYQVKLPVDDKLGKERAWYEKEIDISSLPKGKYSIYIETKSNVSDIGELNEQLFRDLTTVTKTINSKKFTFDVNYGQRFRVELKVE